MGKRRVKTRSWKAMQDSLTITMEQNVRLQGGICPENVQLDKIQNGWISDIIDFYMSLCHIWKTIPDS